MGVGAGQSVKPPRDVHYDEENHFFNSDGLRIFTRCWPAEDVPPRGLVFVGHGLGEHCGRPGYVALAKRLSSAGLMVIAHDHVGHGRSEGARIDVGDFAVYARDVIQHVERKHTEIPNGPIYLIGHSMGGAIAFLTVLERPNLVDGVIFSAPALEPFPEHVGVLSTYGLPVLATLLPHTVVKQPCPTDWLTRDEKQIEVAHDDPFYYTGGTKARWANAFFSAMATIEEHMSDINVPFLVAHGAEDKVTNIDGSRHLYERAKSNDKTLEEIPDAVHGLLHEIPECQEKVIELFAQWIEERVVLWHDNKPSPTE